MTPASLLAGLDGFQTSQSASKEHVTLLTKQLDEAQSRERAAQEKVAELNERIVAAEQKASRAQGENGVLRDNLRKAEEMAEEGHARGRREAAEDLQQHLPLMIRTVATSLVGLAGPSRGFGGPSVPSLLSNIIPVKKELEDLTRPPSAAPALPAPADADTAPQRPVLATPCRPTRVEEDGMPMWAASARRLGGSVSTHATTPVSAGRREELAHIRRLLGDGEADQRQDEQEGVAAVRKQLLGSLLPASPTAVTTAGA